MENQSGRAQYGMADHGFRPFSLVTSAPSTAQQHAGSSSTSAVIQVAALPSHTGVNIEPVDDGYSWRMCGQGPTQDGQIFYYQCAQANCVVQRSVARSADGQTMQTIWTGHHNHPQQSGRVESISEDCVLLEASDAAGAAGPSEPGTGNGANQLSDSSDSEEDNDGDVGTDGDAAAGDANAMQRVRSEVWEEFERVYDVRGKLDRARCKYCNNELRAKTINGTSHLRRHLKGCHAKSGTSKKGKQKCSTSQSDLPVSKKSKYGQENPPEGLVTPIASNLHPFSTMHSASLSQSLTGRNTALSMVQQAAVEDNSLSVFRYEKLKLKEKIIATPGGVFLSLGVWSWDLYIEAWVICLTVHFIDEDWKINRKTIRCTLLNHGVEIKYPDWHLEGAEDLKIVLEKTIQDWGFMQKLLGATLMDEESRPTPMYYDEDESDPEDYLSDGKKYLLAECKLLSIRCMVDALHELMDSFYWDRRGSWYRYMTNSPERKQKLREVLSQLHLDRPHFGSKEWYMKFYWCEATLQFVKSFPLPAQSYFPSPDDLQATENFCRIARPFHHAIKEVSHPYNATFNSYFHVVWSLRETLQELLSITNIERVFKVGDVQRKFDEIWNKWYSWLSTAVILDPRYKLGFIEHCFTQAFNHDARKYISGVRAKLYDLYIRYFYVKEQSNETLNHRNGGSDIQINARLENQSQNYVPQAVLDEFKELSEYLGGGLCPPSDSFDILKWWRDNSSVYPTLARMARDILAIPACVVSAESAFDRWDQRRELFNGKLCRETTEAFICTQDWIKSSGTAGGDIGYNNTLFNLQ